MIALLISAVSTLLILTIPTDAVTFYKWRRVGELDNKIVSGAFITLEGQNYRTFCAQTCSLYPNCYSFFFTVTNSSCYLHGDVYSLGVTSPSPNTRYYVTDSRLPPTTTAAATTTASRTCPSFYTIDSGYCFHISTNMLHFASARNDCLSHDADLMIIDNQQKQDWIENYLKINGYFDYYIFGLHEVNTTTKGYRLVDGRDQDSAPYNHWAPTEPNNDNSTLWVGVLAWYNSQTNLYWFDSSPTYDDYYICEFV